MSRASSIAGDPQPCRSPSARVELTPRLAGFRHIGELNAVVDKQSVDAIRNRFNECLEEGGSSLQIGFFDELDYKTHQAKSPTSTNLVLGLGPPLDRRHRLTL
jgi:hypothetical protein